MLLRRKGLLVWFWLPLPFEGQKWLSNRRGSFKLSTFLLFGSVRQPCPAAPQRVIPANATPHSAWCPYRSVRWKSIFRVSSNCRNKAPEQIDKDNWCHLGRRLRWSNERGRRHRPATQNSVLSMLGFPLRGLMACSTQCGSGRPLRFGGQKWPPNRRGSFLSLLSSFLGAPALAAFGIFSTSSGPRFLES